MTITAINQTDQDKLIKDLSIPNHTIPASSEIILTDFGSLSEIRESKDLAIWIEAGDIILKDEGKTYNKNDSISILNPIYTGNSYSYVESEAEQKTTSSKFVEKVSLAVESLPFGNYRITWYSELSNSSTKGRVVAKLEQNNEDILGYAEIEPKDSRNWYPFSGFKLLVGISGDHSFDFDISNQNSGTSIIKNVRIDFWRIS